MRSAHLSGYGTHHWVGCERVHMFSHGTCLLIAFSAVIPQPKTTGISKSWAPVTTKSTAPTNTTTIKNSIVVTSFPTLSGASSKEAHSSFPTLSGANSKDSMLVTSFPTLSGANSKEAHSSSFCSYASCGTKSKKAATKEDGKSPSYSPKPPLSGIKNIQLLVPPQPPLSGSPNTTTQPSLSLQPPLSGIKNSIKVTTASAASSGSANSTTQSPMSQSEKPTTTSRLTIGRKMTEHPPPSGVDNSPAVEGHKVPERSLLNNASKEGIKAPEHPPPTKAPKCPNIHLWVETTSRQKTSCRVRNLPQRVGSP